MRSVLLRRCSAVVGALAAALIVAAPAAAAGIDVSSDHSALVGYHGYLSALVDGAGSGRQNDQALVSLVKQACPSALKSLASRPKGQVSQQALNAFGVELGGDLTLRFLSEAHAPFGRLSGRLSGLRWSSRSTTGTVHAMLAAERAVLGLAPTHLCVDARALAAQPGSTPPATATFASTYLKDSATLKRQLGNFLSVLQRFQTSQERSLILSINRQVSEFASDSNAAVKSAASAIESALGFSSG